MNQRTYLGARPTLLDVAKDAVEKFLKARARDMASRGDRYMLLTFEDPPHNIKAGWKESHAVFMNELKHLIATGVTNMGPALKNAFDLLNLNRMQSGIDTYGVGRAPYYLEPSMIIVITDGSSLTHQNGVQSSLELPMQNHVVPGSELTREPFRWDQRLFSLVLRLTGSPPNDSNSSQLSLTSDQHSSIGAMCAVTAGRSYTITTQRSILQSIDALVQKVQSGVVIQFEKIGPDPPLLDNNNVNPNNNVNDQTTNNTTSGLDNHPGEANNYNQSMASNNVNKSTNNNNINNNQLEGQNTTNNINQQQQTNNATNNIGPPAPAMNVPPNWHSCRSLIYVHRSLQKNFPVGHWPIPEAYWPDPNMALLPPRTAHPIVKFTCCSTEPHMLDSLPFDKYELESSPLTQYILSRKQPHVAWQVFITNSGKQVGDLGAAFGYLKAATSLNCVNLFVMPYNYPMLLPIIDEILKKPQHPGKPVREWKPAFDEYLRQMPPYYATPLKRALTRMGAIGSLIPESMDLGCISYAVAAKLKSHKNEAKAQFDRLIQAMQHQQNQKNHNLETVRVLQCGKNLRSQVESTSYKNMVCTGQPAPAFYYRYSAMKSDLNEFANFAIRVRDRANNFSSNENVRTKHTFRNPFDIDRKDLIDQIHLMRSNFMQSPTRIKFKDEDQIHTLPVAQMGNYQDYLKKQPAPLREIESTPVRQHMFGNPFKIDKKGMMVDEADSLGAINSDVNSPSQKNKKLNPNQRRRGPLPKDFIMIDEKSWRRSPGASPVGSPSPSPTPSSDAPDVSSSSCSSATSDWADQSRLSSSSSSSSSPTNNHPEQNGNSHKAANADNNITTSKQTINNGSNNNNNNNNGSNHNNSIRPTEQDLALRSDIFKFIRGPGMDYNSVLRMISKLQGEKRKYMLDETIREAKRFKKVRLLHQLNVRFNAHTSRQ